MLNRTLPALLLTAAAAAATVCPPPNNPPGYDIPIEIDLPDPMDSTSVRIRLSAGYSHPDEKGEGAALLSNLQVKAEIRPDAPPGSFGELQDWFDNQAQPVSHSIEGTPLPGELMTILVTGLQPSTSYYFGVQGTDAASYQSLLSTSWNVAGIETATDSVDPDPVRPSETLTVSTGSASATLSIVTPGDDEPYNGVARSLEFKASTQAPGGDLEAWFENVAVTVSEPTVGVQGERQEVVLGGLSPDTTYYVIGRATDEAGREGDLVGAYTVHTSAGSAGGGGGSESGGCGSSGGAGLSGLLAAGLVFRRRR